MFSYHDCVNKQKSEQIVLLRYSNSSINLDPNWDIVSIMEKWCLYLILHALLWREKMSLCKKGVLNGCHYIYTMEYARTARSHYVGIGIV